MLNMRADIQEDVASSASSIPLPSSPIAIPTPAPKLKLDFGTPEMLSPFAGMTDAVLTEIKVLQDPKNITTGRPSCGPVKWPLENKRPCPLPREPVVSETLSADVQSEQALTKPENFNVGHTPKTEDPFSHDFSPITVPGLSLQSEPNAIKQNSSDQTMPKQIATLDCASVHMDAKPHHSYAESTSTLEVRNPDGIEDFAGVSMRAMSDVSTTPAKSLVSHAKESVTSEEEPGSPIELLELPPPLFSLPSKDVGNNNDRGQTKCAVEPAHELQVDCAQRPLIAPSVSALSSLIAGADQKSREDFSIEKPVTAGLSLSRRGSRSGVARKSSDSSYENDDTPMKAKAWSPLSAIDLASIRAVQDPLMIQRSDYLRRDSLFEDPNVDGSNEDDIPQHGPPSPTRKLKLPLRPKNEFISRASYKSLVFKPNLDRAAAKQLGVFRAGSDPSLRQRYFPHLPIMHASPLWTQMTVEPLRHRAAQNVAPSLSVQSRHHPLCRFASSLASQSLTFLRLARRKKVPTQPTRRVAAVPFVRLLWATDNCSTCNELNGTRGTTLFTQVARMQNMTATRISGWQTLTMPVLVPAHHHRSGSKAKNPST
jgi:hypothetical protein